MRLSQCIMEGVIVFADRRVGGHRRRNPDPIFSPPLHNLCAILHLHARIRSRATSLRRTIRQHSDRYYQVSTSAVGISPCARGGGCARTGRGGARRACAGGGGNGGAVWAAGRRLVLKADLSGRFPASSARSALRSRSQAASSRSRCWSARVRSGSPHRCRLGRLHSRRSRRQNSRARGMAPA